MTGWHGCLARLGQTAVALALLTLASPAVAQDEPARPPKLGVEYTSDVFVNVSGGLRRDSALLGKLDLHLNVNGGQFGLGHVEGFVDLQYVHGGALSDDIVGDAQVVSNIEAVSAIRPLEAWVQFPLADPLSIKMGLIDLNGDFDVQTVGAYFINSSHGIGPEFSQSGLNGPSIFPTTAGAVVFRLEQGNWKTRLGLFDAVAGDPDCPRRTRIGFPGDRGLLAVGELERRLGDGSAVKLGVWGYSTHFDAIGEFEEDGSSRSIRGNKGAYVTIEGRLAETASGAVDGWLRLGIANSQINPMSTAIGGGLTFGTDKRRIGLAIARARLGGPAARLESDAAAAETNFELTYAHAITSSVTLQPDIQYVVNPGWRRDVRNALVFGVRTILSFEAP